MSMGGRVNMLRLGVFSVLKSQVAYSCFAFVICLLPACVVFCSLSVCWFLEVSEEFPRFFGKATFFSGVAAQAVKATIQALKR